MFTSERVCLNEQTLRENAPVLQRESNVLKMAEITVRVTSLKKHLFVFRLPGNTTTDELYGKVAEKSGFSAENFYLIEKNKVVERNETEIRHMQHTDDILVLTFQQKAECNEIEEFEKIKKEFLTFCLGREPRDDEIRLSNRKEVDDALRLIYDGNSECRKNGFVFIPERVTQPKEAENEVPTEERRSTESSVYHEELGTLREMGFNDEQRNIELLQKFNGNIQRVVNFLLRT